MSVNRGLTKGPSKAQMETSSQKSSDKQSQLSVISETSSMLVGSVSSAAAKAPLKESKTIVKDRSIVFWTPCDDLANWLFQIAQKADNRVQVGQLST